MFTSVRTPRLFRKGARLLERGASEEALACFEALIVKDPTDAAAHAHVGRCNLQLGRFEAAMASFRRACELQPDEADYHTGLGVALLRLERLPEALDAYQEAARLEPGLVRGVLGLADTFLCSEEYDLALSAYSRAAKLDTESGAAQLGLGRTHLALGNHEEARHALNRASALEPDNGAVFGALADLHAAVGDDAEVLPAREEAARLQPFSAEAQAALGALYARAEEWKKAFTCCQRALRLNPDLREARETLAVAHEQLKEQGDDEVLARLRRMETRGQEEASRTEPEPVEAAAAPESGVVAPEASADPLDAAGSSDAKDEPPAFANLETATEALESLGPVLLDAGPESAGWQTTDDPVDDAPEASAEDAQARLDTFDADLNAWLDEVEAETPASETPEPQPPVAEEDETVVAFDFVVENPESIDLGDAWSNGNGGGTRDHAADQANPFELDDAAIASCLDYIVGAEAESEPVTDFASVSVVDDGDADEGDAEPLDIAAGPADSEAGLRPDDEDEPTAEPDGTPDEIGEAAPDEMAETSGQASDVGEDDADAAHAPAAVEPEPETEPLADSLDEGVDGPLHDESHDAGATPDPECLDPATHTEPEAEDGEPQPGEEADTAGPVDDRFAALMDAGEDAYAAGNYEAALQCWTDAGAMPGAGPACHNNRAAALMALDRLEEAQAACRAALECDAAYAVAHATLAELAAARGDTDARDEALANLAALDETLAAELRATLGT